MKCDILCIKCYGHSLLASAIHPKDLYICVSDVEKAGGCINLPLPIPEERKYVHGQALRDVQCDICGKPIVEDEECVARTIIGYQQEYTPWEKGFVQ